jgi:MerR family transcriptional regulator, copper efflux regulator
MSSKPRHLTVLDVPALERVLSGSGLGDGVLGVDASDVPQLEPGELLQVGELAKATGKTVRAIHLYEDLGLLRPTDRSKGRYRLFNQDALVRVRWISKLQNLGLSLSEIQEVARELDASSSAKIAAERLRHIYVEKLAETRQKLSELAALQRELEVSLRFLSICDSACESAVPTHSCPTCDRHPEQEKAPELVVGAQAH